MSKRWEIRLPTRSASSWLNRLRRLPDTAVLGRLVLVLLPSIGVTVKGARRWLRIGALTIQPSEVVKLGVVLYLAHYLALEFPTQFASVATFAGADPFSRDPCPTPYPAVARKPAVSPSP